METQLKRFALFIFVRYGGGQRWERVSGTNARTKSGALENFRTGEEYGSLPDDLQGVRWKILEVLLREEHLD